jgi:hypothetical protein
LSLPGAAIAAWAGPQYGLAENPPSLVLSSSPWALDQLQQTAVGLAFDPDRSEYIVAEQEPNTELPGEIQMLSTSGAVLGSYTANCSGTLSGLFYTGGSNAFVSCFRPYNSTLLEFNLTQKRFMGGTGTAFGAGVWTFATNPQRTVGYVSSWDDTLGSVDLQTGAVIANVSLPGSGFSPLLFDNETGQLLYGDTGNSSIGVVDPASMSLVRLVPTAGNVSAFGQDPESGEIFVSYYSDPNESRTGTEVFNATSLTEVADFPSPAWYYPFFDVSRGELYLTDGATVHAVSLSPLGLPLGSFALDSGILEPVIAAYDPTSDQIAVASLDPGSVGRAGLAEIQHHMVHAPAYSAVPVVGTASPIAVGVGMFLAGFALLLVRDRRQIRIAKALERRRGLMR